VSVIAYKEIDDSTYSHEMTYVFTYILVHT